MDPNNRVIARSAKATDIIDYITNNLSMFAVTGWNAYILRASELYETGQIKSAQRIVSDCLRHRDGIKTSLRKHTKLFLGLSLQ